MEQDKARKWTDRRLRRIESQISKIYKKSAKGIIKKWDDFMQESADKVSQYQTEYEQALASGNEDLIKSREHTLKTAMTNQTLGNRYYRNMVADVTNQLANLNEKAVAYVNGQIPSIYSKNFNFIDKDTDRILASNNIDFSLVDEAVIKRRVLDGDITLPKKKVDVPKDKKWNSKQLNSSVLQGILQGESMDDIAKRILPIVDNNEVSSLRNARTMVTQAENQGRLDRYKELESKGAVIKKVWMATGDDRTRGWHLTMDGQEKDLDDPFIDGNGKELMMPGDPKGPANSVYNCRCTTTSHILGFRKPDGSIKYIDYDGGEPSMHEQEIESEKARRNKANG